MKSFFAILALVFSANALAADELIVNVGGTQTIYTGTLFFESEGLGGTITIAPLWTPTASPIEMAGPQQTGAWLVSVRGEDGVASTSSMQCSARISKGSTCSTATLACVDGSAVSARRTK